MARMTNRKRILLLAAALSVAGCTKPKPSAIGPNSVFINQPDGRALIYNPDNGATEMEPNRDAAWAKMPNQLDALREVNPRDPQIPDMPCPACPKKP
jgi:hypothetical protein